MQRQLIITRDGSHTISIPGMNVTYHSHHGAIQESMHVFINAGLNYLVDTMQMPKLHIFEVGLGTGLNALLSLVEAEKLQQPVHYTAVELYPLLESEFNSLNYIEQLKRTDLLPAFHQLHQCEWEKDVPVTRFFTLHKLKQSLPDFVTPGLQHLVYFDSFAPAAQPEHWTKEVFEKLFSILLPGGILVTYCSKSIVRKAMEEARFLVTKIPGPQGKREMVRAVKKS